MKIGMFTQGFVRTDSSPQERFAQAIKEGIAAEEAGLSSFGVSEQHFKFPTNSTGPIDPLLAAVAQATSTIEITPGAVILPLHHPLSVAERWAGIDIISNGRVRFGVGKGNTPLTFDVFGVDAAEAHRRTVEALSLIVTAWTQERFSFDGEFWTIPEVGLCPRPITQPHPPLGWSGLTVESAETAASMQLGLMTGAVANSWEDLERNIAAYNDNWDAGTPLPNAQPERSISVLINGHLGYHFDEVREQVAHGLVPYVNRVVMHKRELLRRTGQENPTYGEQYLDNFEAACQFTPSLFGTPEDCMPTLERLRALGVDEVQVVADYAQHEENLRSIKLLGEMAAAL